MKTFEGFSGIPLPLRWYVRVAAFLLCLAAGTIRNQAQAQELPAVVAADTTTADTLETLVIAGMGQLESVTDTSSLFYTNFLWTDIRSLQGLFKFTPGMILRDLGRPGLPDQLVFGGIDGKGTLLMMDGRPLTDPVTGFINPYDIPIEFIDHLELKTFHRSFVDGPGASMAAVNIVSRQYNTPRPITKIRFMQGPYEHLLTDALFTQNVTRPVNILFGVQRQVSENRFLNSSYDSWNVRSRIRYNLSRRMNISLTDFYRSSVVGMNNGIDFDSTRALSLDPFNEAEAIAFSESASESHTRRDVTLAAQILALDDSLSPTKLNVYFATAEREYTDPTGQTSGLFDRYSYEIHGLSLRQSVQVEPLDMNVGGQIERRIAGLGGAGVEDNTMLAWYADVSADFGVLLPGAMLRGERNGVGQGFSWGAHAEIKTGNVLSMTAGWSDARRFPTFQELHWPLFMFSGTSNLVEHHRVAFLRLRVETDRMTLSAEASQRTIDNALLFKTTSPIPDIPPVVAHGGLSLNVRQVSGSVTLNLKQWELEGGITWTQIEENKTINLLHPRFAATGEISFREKFFGDALEARFCAQARFVGSYTGTRFYPSAGIFAQNTGKNLEAFSTFDLYGVFHIGDAFLNVTWENPLDREFMTVYPYPAMGRNIKVGINWIFLD